MADDYKTLRVPEGDWETAKEQKEGAGRTWGEQIVRPDADDYREGTTVVVESVEVPAEVDAGGGVSPEDVETIVENWMETNADRLRRGDL